MPITYDSATNTITVVGGTEDNPYTFEDIYNADQANGWGVFTKLSEGVYKTTAKLQFGDGTTETWFKEAGTTLIIDHVATTNGDTVVNFKDYCNAQFGEKEDVNGNIVVKNGVIFILRDTTYNDVQFKHDMYSEVKYYECKFNITTDSKRYKLYKYMREIVGCLASIYICMPTNTLIKNTIISGRFGHIASPLNCSFSNLYIIPAMNYAFWFVNYNVVVSNSRIATLDHLASVNNLQSPNVIKFINCKAHNWKIRWYLSSGATSGELQRIYACKFKIVDKNGNPLANRTVKVYNKNGDKIAEVTTDTNGETPEVEILYAKLVNPYADDTWHIFYDEDWEYFNPFVVEVWYANELEYKGILTDLDVESTFIQITVKPSSFTLDDIYNLQDKIRKYLTNRWKIENNQLIIYDDDGITPILTFDLFDQAGRPTEVNVYERRPKS